MSSGVTEVRFQPLAAGSSSNVYKYIILGKVDAGATLDVDLERESGDIRSQVRAIYQTDPLAPHPLSAHPRVPEKLRQAVGRAVLKMAAEKEGAEVVRVVGLVQPVAADYVRDYQKLEAIDIEQLPGVE
jgi:phosphonate transport system substrate-binding protein